ncbi:hypothetical protein D3C85_1828950 [compost metagenome]
MPREQRIAAQRHQPAGRILIGDAAVEREAPPQPRRDLFVEDHRRRARGPFINDQADRVRTNVDDGRAMDRLP